MVSLTEQQIITIHDNLIDIDGGELGVRDYGLLASAVNSAFASYGNEEFYPNTIEKICRISYGIIKNHAFIDGNKRTGLKILCMLLELNNLIKLPNTLALEHAVLLVAGGELDFEDYLLFVKQQQSLTLLWVNKSVTFCTKHLSWCILFAKNEVVYV